MIGPSSTQTKHFLLQFNVSPITGLISIQYRKDKVATYILVQWAMIGNSFQPMRCQKIKMSGTQCVTYMYNIDLSDLILIDSLR